MIDKADSAFRTISEAAEEIGVPAHVLRFWETRFPQLQPLKRAGGRRYYRPADMALLRQIRALLHDQGMTIRGAQLSLTSKASANTPNWSPAVTGSAPPATAPERPASALSPPASEIDRSRLILIRDRLAAALAA